MVEILTIDGPSASGKGTLAIRVALLLNWHILPSGSIYRCLALNAMRHEVAPEDEMQLVQLIPKSKINFSLQQDSLRINLSGEDVSAAIVEDSIAKFASQIARHSKLRRELLAYQRSFAQPPGLVAEGRDMGSVVFPDAKHKVFITAAVEVRARRRLAQLQAQHSCSIDEQQLLRDLKLRDKQDRERHSAPLIQPAGASIIDTTDLSIEQSVTKILALLQA